MPSAYQADFPHSFHVRYLLRLTGGWMRRLLAVVLMFGLLTTQLLAQGTQAASAEVLLGFTAQSSAEARAWEQKFKAVPSPQRMREYMQRLSARPHHVGSPYDKDNAEWILKQLQSFGW